MFLNFNRFWGFQKNEYIFRYDEIVDIFFFFWGGGVHHKTELFQGVIYIHFRAFLRSRYRI